MIHKMVKIITIVGNVINKLGKMIWLIVIFELLHQKGSKIVKRIKSKGIPPYKITNWLDEYGSPITAIIFFSTDYSQISPRNLGKSP